MTSDDESLRSHRRRHCTSCGAVGHNARTCDELAHAEPKLSGPASSSCAVCAKDVAREELRFAPLGKDDALVRVCASCDGEDVPTPKLRRPVRLEGASARAAQVRRHRDQLKSEGLCANGRKHGPVEPGRTLCPTCRRREAARNRRDREARAVGGAT